MFVQIFSTGGTIDKLYFDALSEYQIGEPMVDELLRDARVGFDYAIESLVKKDSLE
ncbi:MAG: asparaginase, partial [Gammaproteobacteria bacterium]|nr:asparaginase [Gammaproteobacteria bacterium]